MAPRPISAFILALLTGFFAVAANAQSARPGIQPVLNESVQISRPLIVGRSAIVVDVGTGRVLFEKNSTSRQPAASMQKVLTALVVLQEGDLSKPVTITKGDTMVEPSKVYLRAGETYTRLQLLQALLVKSGNDAARALARDNAGSIPMFAYKMNRLARYLGAQSSNFVNPNGLPAEDQYSCARDIAIIARAAYRSPTIRNIVSMKTLNFARPGRGIITYKNTNKLLVRAPFCNGMKTGYTDAAGHCLVSTGSDNGRDAIVVVMHSTKVGIWNDSFKLLSWGLGS